MSDDVYGQEIERACWLIEAGQDKRAIQILTRLIANHPDNAGPTHMALAYAYSGAGRLEEAEATARKAIAALPNAAEAHQVLAHSLIYQDKESEAEHSLKTALNWPPKTLRCSPSWPRH